MTAPIRIAFALLMLFSLPLAAQDIDLTTKIAPGKWALAYQRHGEFKPLGYKHKENGTSYTCIDGDAWSKIVDWVGEKGCTIDKETAANGTYRLEGQCRLKWWKSHAIPVSIELHPETATRFTLDIRTMNDALLGFTEHTVATHQGACEADSAPKPKHDQGAKT